MGQFLVLLLQSPWSIFRCTKRVFLSLCFVPMISIVFQKERVGSYFFFVRWLLIFSGVLILTCCNMHVYTCCFGSCICGVGNDAIWESYLLNLRDGKHFLPCSLPEPLVCCTVHEYFTPIWVVALYIQLICGQCTWKWYFQNNNLALLLSHCLCWESFTLCSNCLHA